MKSHYKNKSHKHKSGVSTNAVRISGGHLLTKTNVDYDSTDEMDELMIPPFFQHALINGIPPPKITELRPWQKGLLATDDWKQNKSCIVVSPTSGGKTLIAEIAIAQLIDDDPNARVIYALPFVALAMEKYIEFKQRFSMFDVRPFFQNLGGDFKSGSIAICTYEKAHSLFNQAVKFGYFDQIKLIIIDEIHMIGDDNRGIVVESLLMKLRMLPKKPRIICLSATVNKIDAIKISMVIDGYFTICEQRTQELRYYISFEGKLFRIKDSEASKIITNNSIKSDNDKILPLIKPLIARKNGQSCLIFVNTRNESNRIALFISQNIDKEIPGCEEISKDNEKIIEGREKLISELAKCSTGLDKCLGGCIMKGIGYHHAGLLLEERKIVEKGIKSGLINIIVATTTLSAGINISSVSRVIVYNPYRKSDNKKTIISPSLLQQMAGRSGRTDTTSGDVIVIARSSYEFNEIIKLYNTPIPCITSNIVKGGDMNSYLLQTLALRLSNGPFTMNEFLKNSFAFQIVSTNEYNLSKILNQKDSKKKNPKSDKIDVLNENNSDEEKNNVERSKAIVNDCLKYLVDNNLVEDKTYEATKLGKAITSSNLSISEGLRLNEAVKKIMKMLCLSDSLHLLYLCIPNQTGIYLPPFTDNTWETIFLKHSHVINLITDKTQEDLRRMIIQSFNGKKLSQSEMSLFERIYAGCVLEKLIDEHSIVEIESMFKIDRGTIQILQTSSGSYAGQATKFCEEMDYSILAAALVRFRKRLEFGVKDELIELMEIPSITREIARDLYNNDIKTTIDICEMSRRDLYHIVKKAKGGFGSGLNDNDIKSISRSIKSEAKKLSKHKNLLDDYAEKATLNAMGK
ncbi:DEAD/DEAH box helicase family protein [Trichomonas vaginalis G3]|uniref:DEAD/DEAH box helicase family protein n=1 Tax=Trichomonas vaginalis (strain ATCC PRA-98 / G3) TaxID=412133 RepID=A2DLF9_TRIV3|nr:putative DNA polymerase theta [Trichomonas vaginalis G3]EAY18777.1 DEAD/DEAH box helicase family protein [Trichomonas vaginalis G3]KAI5539287.1 putative DNA polymerase theta [Trichomonas vaginalis G3]|eukprot:XP_001579763.1 DEAD/DEAH box helicase family protein [Trichomonas vaginalis G3]